MLTYTSNKTCASVFRSSLLNLPGRNRSMHPKKHLKRKSTTSSKQQRQMSKVLSPLHNNETHLCKSPPPQFHHLLFPCLWSGAAPLHRAADFSEVELKMERMHYSNKDRQVNVRNVRNHVFGDFCKNTFYLDDYCRVPWWSVQHWHWRTSTTICTVARSTFSQASGYQNR